MVHHLVIISMENIVMITNRFLIDMVVNKYTDIHMECIAGNLKITKRRYKETLYQSTLENTLLFNQLKVYAKFDVTSRGAQTGVFEWIVKGRSYQFRFSAIDQNNHTSGVLRLLNVHDVTDLSMITSDQTVLDKVKHLMNSRSGIVLLTGKTGSGKSTSMFYFLHFLCDRMVYTLENPIERLNPKWVQIDTKDPDESVGQLLRHDPDVIVLGEIRSNHEIKALLKAGLSGHFVMSTMHAGSVSQALRRLVDLGVSEMDLLEMVNGIIHQDMKLSLEGKVELSFDIKNSEEIRNLIKNS